MRVLIVNGSPRIGGNTTIAIEEIEKIFKENDVEFKTIQIGNKDMRGCVACNFCAKNGRCAFDDEVNETASYFKDADGLIVASPVYFASANGTLISFLDRLFYSTHFDKRMKVGASVAVCRRGGASATFDELNKYFTIASMPVVSSTYWNSVHGRKVGEAVKDEEGLQTMRNLARNMIFLMKAIDLAKKEMPLPENEHTYHTNFIHD